MIVELTEADRFIDPTSDYSRLHWRKTLAWRAFGKAIGVQVDDPRMVMDSDGSEFEPVTKRYFYFEEAEGDHFLSLGQFGCWDGGAMRSLSSKCTYISYGVDSDKCFV